MTTETDQSKETLDDKVIDLALEGLRMGKIPESDVRKLIEKGKLVERRAYEAVVIGYAHLRQDLDRARENQIKSITGIVQYK